MAVTPEEGFDDETFGSIGREDDPTAVTSSVIDVDVPPWEMARQKAAPPTPRRTGGFSPDIEAAIDDAAGTHGVDGNLLRTFAKIESGGDPRKRTGSYKGLFQLSDDEFGRNGGTDDIFDPIANSRAAALKLKAEQAAFEKSYGRTPSASELYFIHQQGVGGADAHWRNPDGAAWENMYRTAEGRQKGPNWAKQAIWGNLPDSEKRRFGSVENVTSRDFTDVWDRRVQALSGDQAPVQVAQAPRQSVIDVELPPWELAKRKPQQSAQPVDVAPWELAKKGKAPGTPEAPKGFFDSTYNALVSGYHSLVQNLHTLSADAAQRELERLDKLPKKEGWIWDAIKEMNGPEEVEKRKALVEEAKKAAISGIAYRKAESEKYPMHADTLAMMGVKPKDDSWGAFFDAAAEGFGHFQKSPATVIANIGAQSLPQILPALFAGVVTRNPYVAATVMGGTSGLSEYSSEIVNAFEEAGVDPKNQEQVAAAFSNPEKMAEIRDKAFRKGAIVGLFDAASVGVASKTLLPKATLAGRPVAREAANIGVQMPVQGVLGAAGEGLGSLAAGKEVTPGALMAEFLGEFSSAPFEVASLRNAGKGQPATGGKVELDAAKARVNPAAPRTTPPPLPGEAAPEAPAMSMPDAPTVAPTPPTPEEMSILRRMGYSAEDIREMEPEQRTAEVEDAKLRGIVGDVPTAEPIQDIVAQARDLADPENERRGLYLSPDNVRQIQENPDFIEQIGNALQNTGEMIQDVDGNGGVLLAKDRATADAVRAAIQNGQDIQQILGQVTGAGQGKPADASAVVQQVTPEGAVTRESAVRDADIEATLAEFRKGGRDARVVTPEQAQQRRQGGEPPPLPGDAVADGSRQAPVRVETTDDVARAEQRVADPTDAQKEAGNYAKGHLKFQGLDITIENPKGSIRRGTSPDGTPWQVEMPATYGYFKRSRGKDGDQIDVYVGDNPASDRVFIIDQVDPNTEKFDEHKVFLGYSEAPQVRDIYSRAFSDGRANERMGGITEMPMEGFKEWLAKGRQTKPVSKLDAKPDTETRQPTETATEQADKLPDNLTDAERETLVKAWRYVNAIEQARAQGRDIQQQRLDIANELDADLASYGIEFDSFPDEQSLREHLGRSRGTDQAGDAVTQAPEAAQEPEATATEGPGRVGSPAPEVVQREQADRGREGDGAPGRAAEVERPKRYEGDPLSSDDIDTIVEQWKYLREVANRPKPESLAAFVVARGGIKDDAREVRHIAGAAKERPGLVNKDGWALDDIALAAWESGFMGDMAERPTIADFLDRLQDDLHTGTVVRTTDEPLLDDIAVANEIARELADYGVTTNRFRSENTLREYFGQERPRVAGEAARDEEAEPATQGRKGQTRPDPDEVVLPPDEAPETGPSDSGQSEYEAIKAERDRLAAEAKAASDALNAFPKGPIGLTPDDVKASPEFKAARQRYQRAADQLREANSIIAKRFAKEAKADRDAERAARLEPTITTEASGQTSLVPEATTKEKIAAEAKKKGDRGKSTADLDAGELFNPDAGKQTDLVDMAKAAPADPYITGKDSARDHVLTNGRKTGTEYGMVVLADGSTKPVTPSERNSKSYLEVSAKTAPDLYDGPAKSADLHHNHPKSSSFSRADYTEASVRPSLRRTWVHGHDGSEYWASFKTNDPVALGKAYDIALAVTETLTEKGYDLPRYRTHIIATMLRDGGLIEYGATLTPARADERIAKIREKLGEDNIAKAIEDIRKLGGTDVYDRRPGSTRSDRDVAGTPDKPAATGSEVAGSRPSDTTRPEDGRAEKDGKAGEVSPIESAFDVAVADQFDAPSTRKKRSSPAKAGKAASSAAKNAGKGLKEAARGLAILFDPKGKVGSGPSFDEKTYQAAKPHFQAALAHFGQAGADTATAVRELVKYLAETAGMSRDGIVAMKPYVMRFMRDVEDGETDIAGPLPEPKKTDEPIKIVSGERLQSKSGRVMAPAPKIDMSTNGRASNSLKRMDKWLYDEATKEAEGNDYLGTILKGIDPKRMSQSDRDVLNDILFGDERGATEANRLKDGADASGGRPSVERDSGRGTATNVVGEASVSADGKQDASRAGPERVGTRQDGAVDSGSRVPDGDAAPVGTASDIEVSGKEPGDGRGTAGDNGSGRSGDARVGRVPAGRVAAEKVSEAAVRTPSLKTVLEAQKKADETVPFVLNDPDNIRAALPALKPAQQDDVIKAEARFVQPEAHGFLFTNGTGTGKTWTGLGVIKRFAKQGKTNILVLAPSQGILNGWISVGRMIGVPISRLDDKSTAGTGIVATTYANFRDNAELVNRTWDMIVADEAHHLSQNATGNPSDALIAFRALTNHSPGARARMKLLPQFKAMKELEAQAKEAAALKPKYEEARSDYFSKVDEWTKTYAAQPRSKALFLSATPFAYRKSTDYAEGFLFNYPETKNSYNNPGGQAEFLQRNFGYAIRYNRAEEPGPEINVGVLEREFYERLKREGALSGRRLEVDADYDRRFVLVDDAVGAKIDQATTWLIRNGNGRYRPLFDMFYEKFNFLSQRRLLEAIKAKHVIGRIKRDFELGRKVVVFHDYNEGGGINPFTLDVDPNTKPKTAYGQENADATYGTLYSEFIAANPYVRSLNFAQFKSPIETLTEAFPEALLYNGRLSDKKRNFALQEFNRDGSGRDIIIVQSAAGEAGISLHDTTGKHQRVLYNLGLPTRPTTAIQQEGRIYREGQVSDAILRYMSTGTGWERSAFAQTIAERASTAENLALGDEARALRDAFIDGFNQADEITQDETEGKGGKQQDRASANLISPYDRAKAFYFAEGKKRGRRDQREGFDYYATPEPIGLKMVEFADVQIGERILEPSAGHGAIARWFPEGANRTVIEPSSSLASRAGLSSPGAKVINSRFEDHHITNKYDGIVMNPPFGSGGKDAIEHLQKAVAHLRNGGRVVAILPRGGMADKRLEAFRDDPANKNIYSAMEIDLPPVMFERAGTKVATRMLVLERHASPDTAPNTSYRDLSDAETVNELFDRIENLSIQARRRPEGSSPVASVPADTRPTRRSEPEAEVSPNVSVTFRTGQTKHGRTGADLFVASIAVPVPRATFDNILAVAKANNGYYSSFRGNGAIPGFQFPTEADRAAFLDKFPSGMREESEAEDFPRVNKDGFVLALPYEAQWGNPRFIKADRERAIARLREIQSIDPDNAPWADLVQAKVDIDRIMTNLYYWDPETVEGWKAGKGTIRGEPSSSDIWSYLDELDNGAFWQNRAENGARQSLFSNKNVPADLAEFADEGGQAVDSLMDSKRKGLRELLKWDDDVDPSKPKAAPPAGNMGDRMPSGFYFKAARKIDEARETLFQMSGQSVINWLTKEGVSRAEINHFQLQEKFGGDAKFTRDQFKQAIGERMFDFRRKMSWLNPERSRGNYELGGTRAFTGPRVPGQGIYFERPIAFPKRLAGGARFAPGEFESPHWYDVLKNAWASWRGSIREVPGWGTMLVGEEGQSDYMQGANTGRRPKMSAAEIEQRKVWGRTYEKVMAKAFEYAKTGVGVYSGGEGWREFLADLAPDHSSRELDFDAWYNRLNEAREAAKYKADDKGRFPPTADFSLETKRLRALDKLLQLRRDNEEYFTPGARKKYSFDLTAVTPESPIDDNYVRVMARDLLLMAAEKAVNSVAISTTATTGRIQNNRRAAHFYDTQMKPALERELRTLTGKWDLTLEKIALPKALGSPKSERPYTVWAAKLDDGTIEKIAKQGMPLLSVREDVEVKPTKAPLSRRDWMRGRMMLRQPVDLSRDAEKVFAIMAQEPSALPPSIPELVVTRMLPKLGTAGRYFLVARDAQGNEHSFEDDSLLTAKTQGMFLNIGGRPFVVLLPVDFGGDLVQGIRGVRAHETVHGLRVNGFLPGDGRDAGSPWGRLVGHADRLGVLAMSRAELYARMNDPRAETASKETTTLEIYENLYAGNPYKRELLDQEAVAHMVELYKLGAWTDQEIGPVKDWLDQLLAGEVAQLEREGIHADMLRSIRDADITIMDRIKAIYLSLRYREEAVLPGNVPGRLDAVGELPVTDIEPIDLTDIRIDARRQMSGDFSSGAGQLRRDILRQIRAIRNTLKEIDRLDASPERDRMRDQTEWNLVRSTQALKAVDEIIADEKSIVQLSTEVAQGQIANDEARDRYSEAVARQKRNLLKVIEGGETGVNPDMLRSIQDAEVGQSMRRDLEAVLPADWRPPWHRDRDIQDLDALAKKIDPDGKFFDRATTWAVRNHIRGSFRSFRALLSSDAPSATIEEIAPGRFLLHSSGSSSSYNSKEKAEAALAERLANDEPRRIALRHAGRRLVAFAESNNPEHKKSLTYRWVGHSSYDTLKPGDTFTDPAFMSTTKTPVRTTDIHPNEANATAVLRVFHWSGLDIEESPFIQDTSLNIGEREVLLPPGRTFEVTAAERNKNGFLVIDLDEIVPSQGQMMFALGGGVNYVARDLDSLGFYSKALEAARGLKQEKGTPEQMLAQLKKAGVKDAEIQATGLDRLFKDGSTTALESDAITLPPVSVTEQPDGRTLIEALSPAGRVRGYLDAQTRTIQDPSSGVNEDQRGKGVGVALYSAFANKAAELGYTIRSANPVTVEAARVYEALKRRGYNVVRHPNARNVDGVVVVDGSTPGNDSPFTIYPQQQGDRTASPPRHDDLFNFVENSGFVIAEQNGASISYAGRPNEVYVHSLEVKPRDRRQGRAHALMQKFVEHADAEGKSIRMHVGDLRKAIGNDNLVEFYRSLGFQTEGERDGNGFVYMVRLPQQQGDRTASPPRRALLNQITRSEIISHLEENRVGLREVVRGDTPENAARIADLEKRYQDAERAYDKAFAERGQGLTLSQTMAMPEARLVEKLRGELHDAKANVSTKWSPYTLDPNGINRETVIHLPARGGPELIPNTAGDWGNTGGAGGMMRNPDFDRQNVVMGHFPEPNIVGHMMTSMTRHEGKPVYLIDQIQSDWGQELRDTPDPAKAEGLRAQLKALGVSEATADYARTYSSYEDLRDFADAGRNFDSKIGAVADDVARMPPEKFSEVQRIGAELKMARDAEVAPIPRHPLVNTTDQWTTTTLRRAIRQAVEAGADYIAIPTGDTVLSYNPGDTAGMRGFYGYHPRVQTNEPALEGIVPKNLRKLLSSIDKSSPAPARIDQLETPSGMKGEGFTLFPLTERVKDSVLEYGQPMFSMVPSPVPDEAVVRDLSKEMTEAISIITRMTGRDAVQVEFRDQIESEGLNPEQVAASRAAGFATRTAGGVYRPRRLDAKPLIALATNDPAYDLRTAAGHEAFHHVERELASEAELRLLTSDSEMRRMRALASDELQMSPSDPRLARLQPHEVRAIAYQRYRRLREEGLANSSRLHIGIRRFFDKMIQIFQGIRNVLKGKGFDSYEAIFERARTGEMLAARDRRAVDQAARERPVRAVRNIVDPQMRPAGYVEREPFDVDNVRLVSRSMLSVPVDAIRTIQKSVSVGRVKAKLGLPESDDGRPVSVFKYGDTYYVNDGNHRVEAMRARGAKTVRAEVIEIEPKDGDAQVLADRGQADVPAQPMGAQEDYEGTQAPLTGGTHLDMSKKARMARAKAMGFDTSRVWYHGTNETFNAFSLDAVRATGEADIAISLTDSKDLASGYGKSGLDSPYGDWKGISSDSSGRVEGEEGGRVIPAYIRLRNPKRIKMDDWLSRGENADLIDAAKSAGHDGIVFTYTTYRPPVQEAMVFDPSNIRSVNAAFDPAEDGSPQLMASLIPAAARVYTARWIRRMQPYTDNIRTYLQDKVLPVRRQEEAIEASTGVKLPDQLSVYTAEAIYHGRAGERLTDLQEKHIEPLTEHLRKTGVTFNELGDYLYARHAKERNAAIRVIDPANNAGSGMTDAEANGIISKLEQGKRGTAFKNAAKMIDAMVTDARDTLYRSGLLTKEQYDNWRTKYQHYVPLRGFEGEVEEWGIPRVGRGMDIRGPESKQALGRRSKADNPAAYVMQQAVQAIIRSEKNRVDKTLYRLIQAHPDPDVWKVFRGQASRRINPATGLVEVTWVPPPFAARNNDKVFGVKIAGKQHYMEILHEPLARALRTGEQGILGTAPGRAFFNLARFYARLVTSFNPEFVVSNYLRDIQTALMNVGDVANKPAGTRKKIIAEALSLKSIRGVMAALQSHEGRTIFGGTRAADETMIGTKRSKDAQDYAKWFEEYRLAGGKISFIEMNDIDRIKTRIERSITEGKTRRALRNVFDLIDNANSAVENGVRLSAYIALRKNGVSQDRAAFAARELTVNFNRKGEYGPAINAFYLFFTASVQGTTRLAQAVTRSPAVRKGAAAIVLVGVLFDLLNYMISGDDDDGENAYEKIDDWKKEKNMIVMLPGRKDYVQIPMPYGYNVFYLFGQKMAALSRTAVGHGKEKPAKAIAGLLGSMVESFSPMGAAPSWLQMASPTLADPFVQIAENKNWFGGKIQPEKFNRFKPDSENFYSTAPDWAIGLARMLNRLGGGNSVKKGEILGVETSVSPESFEHIAEFLLGGVGKFIGNVWNTGQRAINGQEWVPEKTPFVRRLYGKSTGESRRRDFYEQWNEVDGIHYQFETLRKAQNREGMAEIRKENPAELQAYEMMRTTQRQLSALRKQADVINLNRDLDAPEKEKRLKIITERENEIILKALKTYARLKKEQKNKP